MGFFSKKTKTSPAHKDMIVSTNIDTSSLSEEKQKRDLEKLMAFDKKIKNSKQTLASDAGDIKQEDKALQLKNPFRGI